MKYIIKNTVGIPNINGLIFPQEEIQKYIDNCQFPILCNTDKGGPYEPNIVGYNTAMVRINSLQIEQNNLIADIEPLPPFHTTLNQENTQYPNSCYKTISYGKVNQDNTITDITYIGVYIDLSELKCIPYQI